MQLQTRNTTGKEGTLTVSDAVFAAPINKILLSQAIHVYLSNERQGTAKVKTRAEVNRTKKKVYKQKGTGGARHGAKSAPIFVGGGVTHGPTGGQNWSLSMPQKQKAKALVSALSWQKDQLLVVDEIEKSTGKTKEISQLLMKVAQDAKSILVVLPKHSVEIARALQNVAQVTVTTAVQVNVLDIVRANIVILTSEAVAVLETRLAGIAAVKASAPVAKKTVLKKKSTKKRTTKVKKVTKK